ncbi:MAG: hypothetical protein EXQ95_09415 [Alphaproteobacteria bacterium]|nr:hypothetical protein [Alphaproteobacteria bacterium]
MPMRKTALVAALALGLTVSQTAEAQTMSILAGAVVGGLAGSVYVNGLQATAAAVSAASVSAVSAIGSAAPAVAGAIAGASAPVVIGVVAGGALGYLLLR